MTIVDVYVEFGVGGHIDDAVQAWVFDLDLWGRCGQGHDETSALMDLGAQIREHRPDAAGRFRVVERIHGDELTFERDHRPATGAERARTQEILDLARADTIALVAEATSAELDYDDPARLLPEWATWRTPRQLAWHIVNTETRYYLAALGMIPPPRDVDLLDELRTSSAHVRRTVAALTPDLDVGAGNERWTTTKVLRRLAWHERGEVVVLRRLLAQARR